LHGGRSFVGVVEARSALVFLGRSRPGVLDIDGAKFSETTCLPTCASTR
jgi:hypothetical protein